MSVPFGEHYLLEVTRKDTLDRTSNRLCRYNEFYTSFGYKISSLVTNSDWGYYY